MSWTLLAVVVAILGLALFAALARRSELAHMAQRVRERDKAVRHGSDKAQLSHPVIDLSRCLGCGTCVAACPEDGVLELVHGQAMVVHGARCVGVSACERECPVGAITVTIANLAERKDVPALSEGLEAIGSPGLFLAGEVTAHALIKTAIDHGTAVAAEVARRVAIDEPPPEEVLDLCIVGAGPAGLSCSLEAKRNGLRFVTLEQEQAAGGTVAKYPRRRLVVSEAIELPLHGRLGRNSYTKEELVDLWRDIAVQHELPIMGGEVFSGVERHPDGHYVVRTQSGGWSARHVCLALGRRGTPQRLGVPGEDLPKVAYSLLDANSYQGRRVLVVGGGDTAVETALGLADQQGNQVTLSYRREAFFRIRGRNEKRLEEAIASGAMQVLFKSQVVAIHPESVELAIVDGPRIERFTLGNDEVFVMAGGIPPVELLERSGVSFDPALRPAPARLVEQGTGLTQALACAFAVALVALIWAVWHADYYLLPAESRPAHEKHSWLRPGMGVGLWMGVTALMLVCANLLYLLRRAPLPGLPRIGWGSLRGWMTSHVATGILAFLLATLHAAMAPRATAGGHAWQALAVLLVTGAIGRYFYAYVPRAANGRELELTEVKARLSRMSEEWDQGQRQFRDRARQKVLALIEARQWKSSFLGRVLALVGVQIGLRRLLSDLAREARAEGIAEDHLRETVQLARRAHRTSLMAAHYEDLRAVLNSWRFVHRWAAALMVLLVLVHVVYALFYGTFARGGSLP